jgi:outer membrane immunogenic protein
MQRSFPYVAIAAILAASGADAADLSAKLPVKAPVVAPVPYYDWSGLYFGVNGGGAFGTSTNTDALRGITTNFPISGGLFGGTVGYNYQIGRTVLGLEGDLDWAGIGGNSGAIGGVNYRSYLQWISTVRGRIGFAFDRVMPYVTGGLAAGGIKDTVTAPGGAVAGTRTDTGWTIGAGIEYGLTPNVSLKAEYLYTDLPATAPVLGDKADVKSSMVRGGVTWRFNWDGPPHF